MGGLMGMQHAQHRDEVTIGSTLPTSAVLAELLPGHSRNSSGTSHSGSGSASGYGSLASQSQHSRQSSSGELGHFRSVFYRYYYTPHSSFCFCSPCFFHFGFRVLFCSIIHYADVDFLHGLYGRRASPSCVYLSAVALASSISPLLHRPSHSYQPKSLLVTHLPAAAADRKQ